MTGTNRRKQHALFIANKIHSSLVFNMAKLEGNPFTYPEIKTLLDGVTVGGHKLSDQEQVLRISNGWKKLIQLIKNEEFKLNKETAINLNVCIAEGEALAVGDFRDGNVLIGGTSYIPPKAEKLYALFQELIDRTNLKKSPDNAYEFFLQSAANQFFWDGNKRTGQLMMNGLLLESGHLPVSIPARSQLQYNQAMTRFYNTGDMEEMKDFLNIYAQEIAAPFIDEELER